MKIQETMTRNVQAISPEDTIETLARRLRDLDIGGMPVREDDRIVGFVTDRDIAIRAVAQDRDPDDTKVRNVMTADPVTIREDQSVEEAADLMRQNRIRRLVVVDQTYKPVGMLALGDLACCDVNAEQKAEVLETVSGGE